METLENPAKCVHSPTQSLHVARQVKRHSSKTETLKRHIPTYLNKYVLRTSCVTPHAAAERKPQRKAAVQRFCWEVWSRGKKFKEPEATRTPAKPNPNADGSLAELASGFFVIFVPRWSDCRIRTIVLDITRRDGTYATPNLLAAEKLRGFPAVVPDRGLLLRKHQDFTVQVSSHRYG